MVPVNVHLLTQRSYLRDPVCTINKSAYMKKVWKLIVCTLSTIFAGFPIIVSLCHTHILTYTYTHTHTHTHMHTNKVYTQDIYTIRLICFTRGQFHQNAKKATLNQKKPNLWKASKHLIS